jgi:hypothetical protein
MTIKATTTIRLNSPVGRRATLRNNEKTLVKDAPKRLV